MAKDSLPSVQSLDKPEKLQDLLKEDRGDDCLSCRIVGGGAFLGLAAYSYMSGQAQLEKQKAKILASGSRFGMRSRSAGITTISLGLVWLGIWRLVK
ncbi:hypothetical protein B0J18DRAFT_470080 [Chaetomium sp. MPI-SDFR-AT-0129]|uniref:Distal membrane-arm assembly complex protein 1-like domain-containing protein n=1 Tax=Dichotomopilus funicola TaxID=1934379 RepID=A0AAN6ZKS2_9PEZI|nr:hypothetical protein B0J18DRAFT_470080 [Chaetomium sp. MPI-SDFR-AT-0129]KAK4142102.1 hypothetical protein C8A04DRAFT_30361 [Dichotomopilus funicola]